LEALGMSADPETTVQPSDTMAFGSVVESILPAKSRVERTTKVRLVLSSGPQVSDGRESVAYDYRLTIQLTDLKKPSRVRIDMRDDRGTRSVFENRQSPNDEVRVTARGVGRKATFRIYYDDRLVKEFDQSAP